MHCKIAPETLTALHERALPWWQAIALKRHARRCTSCQSALTQLGQLDTQLRTLAPIPAELRQPFAQKHRRLIIGSSLALAVLSLGAWRFFTPDLEWEEVRKEAKKAQIISWHTKSVSHPVTIFTDPAEWFLRKTNLQNQDAYPKSHEHTSIYNRSKPLELNTSDDSRSLIQRDYMEILIPNDNRLSVHTDISQLKRLVSFTTSQNITVRGANGNLTTETITITLADPKTRHIVQRTSYTMNSGTITYLTVDTDFKYQYD